MANKENASQPVEGVPVNPSRDVVDTSWDIPPLSFPGSEPIPKEFYEDSADGVSSSSTPLVSIPELTDIPHVPVENLSFEASENAGASDTQSTMVQNGTAPSDASEETQAATQALPLDTGTLNDDAQGMSASDADALTQVLGSAVEPPTEIEDLEQLAEEDPEHDPLKTVPAQPKKEPSSKGKHTAIAIIAAIVAAVVAATGILVVRNKIDNKEKRAAIAVCQKAKDKYLDASKKLQDAVKQAADLQNTASNQVADATTIEQLNKAVNKAQNLDAASDCSVLQSETTLRTHARNMSKQVGAIKKQTKAVTTAATAVASSKKALNVTKTNASLRKAIADARTLLADSEGAVADESTRDALAKAIDAAQKLIDGKSTDVTAMQNASKALSSSSDAVNKSVEEQAAATAQANANSNSDSNLNTDTGTTNQPGYQPDYSYIRQLGPTTGGSQGGGNLNGGNQSGGNSGGNGESGQGNGSNTGGSQSSANQGDNGGTEDNPGGANQGDNGGTGDSPNGDSGESDSE